MPETLDGTYYADAATAMSLAGITAAQAASIDNRFNGGGPGWIAWGTVPSGITVGNGTLLQRYRYAGGLVRVEGSFILGTTSAVSGSVVVAHPVTVTAPESTLPFTLGDCILNNGSGTYYVGKVSAVNSTTCRLLTLGVGGTFANVAAISSTSPFTWATGYSMTWSYTIATT